MSLVSEIVDSLKNHPDDWELKNDFPYHKKYALKLGDYSGSIYWNGPEIYLSELSQWRILRAIKILKAHKFPKPKIIPSKIPQTLADFGECK